MISYVNIICVLLTYPSKNTQVFNCFLNLSFLKLHVDTKNDVSIINVTKILYISVYTFLCLDKQRHQRKQIEFKSSSKYYVNLSRHGSPFMINFELFYNVLQ